MVPVLGWVECTVGFLFLAVSVLGFTQAREEFHALLWDAFTFLLLLLTLRYPRIGMAALIVAGFAGLMVDPEGIGMAHYIAACGVVLAVRLGRFPLAVVGTATLGIPLFITMYRRSGDRPVTLFFATLLLYLIVWVLGLGSRSVGKAEAARVEARHRQRQLAVATDLHDFVARNLSALVLAAESLPQDDPVIASLAERARLANSSLRSITSMLREDGNPDAQITSIGAEEALEKGIEAISLQGGHAQVAKGTKAALTGLPGVVDRACGRILSEALCNVARHAALEEPVVIVAERTEDRLDLLVTNGIGQPRAASPDSMGLMTVRQHAEVLGGRAESSSQGNVWVCTASLPLSNEGVLR
ncbi:MAG: hypothetical protein IPJ61_17310 [Tessaracoccus sp.]|uniref:sensor histidine kinase n=1 Tax=Tessaracoccus sp. TaxID=1971211 RepID=UPI001ED4DFA4|nr:hypothetical protein [Tessaracoccus sp.]MBK7822769.1 hypothetical protein [Tessaracoccus sp.]